jgi:SAM-dependent methyltransferase
MKTNDNQATMDKVFLDEYTSHDAILKYSRATAGYGVSYLLDHDYKDVYLKAIAALSEETKRRGIRVLEYGCGAGMNLVHLLSVLKKQGVKVLRAVGTDFSPVLIAEAQKEARQYLPADEKGRLEFYVARNESLDRDIATATGEQPGKLSGTFDFIFGVNTNRYCHRFGRQVDCTRSIRALLVPGGVSVAIDMNDRFPAFRSSLKNHFRKIKEEECYIPSLQEYAAPYKEVGFQVLRQENFCWVPHSSGPFMCFLLHTMTPLLSAVARSRAMRSLVVVKKPA